MYVCVCTYASGYESGGFTSNACWWLDTNYWPFHVICSKLIIVIETWNEYCLWAPCSKKIACHIRRIPQISLSPSFFFTLIGFPLRLQPSCFYLTTLQPHFPYQYYLCHFDKHSERCTMQRLEIREWRRAAASGFYSGSIFSAGVRLRFDVMSWPG